MPSNTREPMCKWVLCGIMGGSGAEVSDRRGEPSRACFGGGAKIPSLLAKPGPRIEVLAYPAVQLLDVTGPVRRIDWPTLMRPPNSAHGPDSKAQLLAPFHATRIAKIRLARAALPGSAVDSGRT